MGQKANPISNRIALTKSWSSKWYASVKDYKNYLVNDLKIRDYTKAKLSKAGVSSIDIIRSRDKLTIRITTNKPGLIIGRSGQGINDLQLDLQTRYYKDKTPVIRVEVVEDKQPDISASLVAQNISSQIEKRKPYRPTIKSAMERTMARGVKGMKVLISGRLGGAEIARKEKFLDGSIPLSKFSANIDYHYQKVQTTYGMLGLKVWIYKGDIEEEVES